MVVVPIAGTVGLAIDLAEVAAIVAVDPMLVVHPAVDSSQRHQVVDSNLVGSTDFDQVAVPNQLVDLPTVGSVHLPIHYHAHLHTRLG